MRSCNLSVKSLDSPNSPQDSISERLFQSRTNNLVKWTTLISADFFEFSEFTSGVFPCRFLFRNLKEPFKYMGHFLIHRHYLKQGWVFSKRTCVFRGIQVTRHFIEFVVVETKQIVGTNSNVILTRQTCGQRSGMAAVSKHRAIAFYFSVRIYYMFLMSKCREKSDLGLCMTSVLAKRMPMTGPASLAEQIGPEHRDGCSLLLLVPLSQLDTTSPLVHTPPRSRPLSLHGHSTWARITACGR